MATILKLIGLAISILLIIYIIETIRSEYWKKQADYWKNMTVTMTKDDDDKEGEQK